MKQTSRIILALILAVAILLANLFSSPLGVAAESQLHRYVRISPSTVSGLDSLGIHPFQKIDYGAFVWLELSQADFARLSRQITYQEDSVAGMQFDPLVQGEPDFPARLMAAESQAGFRLVQFAAPILDAWLKKLQASGAEPLQYYPNNA